MGRFSLWRLRAGRFKLLVLTGFLVLIAKVIEEWLIGDIVAYIRSVLGVDMNIIELMQRMPFTIIAIVATILIGIWIFKKGDRDSALRDLYKLLLDIREVERLLVANASPNIIVQHQQEMNQEIDLLVLQKLADLKEKKRGKEGSITSENLTDMRIERLIPENAEIESLKRKDKKLSKLWREVRLLQTAFMDGILDRRITWFERMIKLNSAYKVYKAVLTNCYIINLDDYMILDKSVIGTENALAKAHSEVNQRLVELVGNKELNWVKKMIKQEIR